MKIRIGFNGSFTGLLYSAGKLNLKTQREKRESRTCWRASASKDVLSRPPCTSSHGVRCSQSSSPRTQRSKLPRCWRANGTALSRNHLLGRLATARDGHVERGEEDREFSFFQGETNTWSNRPLPLFWKGHNALLFARCTRDASANSTSFLIIVPLINYSYSLLWIWKRYILSLF